MTSDSPDLMPSTQPDAQEAPRWGGLLVLWVASVVVLHGVLWLTGVRNYALMEAVEQGTARVENRLGGEETEDVVRKEIQLQRDTLPFWRTLRAMADFLVVPLALIMRPLVVAICFSSLAALTGRPVRHAHVLAGCVFWQGMWVLRVLVQVLLMLVLWRSTIDSSVLILLPSGVRSAPSWAILRQIDLFALIGWIGMGWTGWRQRQAHCVAALVICFILAVLEVGLWASGTLLLNLGMRLTLLPT
jgi:hypothetical protein